MVFKELSTRIVNKLLKSGRVSYSQCGEDLIIDFFFSAIRQKPRPSYLDIGAYHPTVFSNTFYFYRKGSRGVCVEPDPTLIKPFQRQRSRDVLLNVGVGTGETEKADFYVMTSKTLSTFSAEEARRCHENTEYKIERVIELPLLSINEIIIRNFNDRPDFISLDIEGYDLAMMRTFDFTRFRPELFCIETIEFTTGKKNDDLIKLMQQSGYSIYADTRINTIFVDGGLI